MISIKQRACLITGGGLNQHFIHHIQRRKEKKKEEKFMHNRCDKILLPL